MFQIIDMFFLWNVERNDLSLCSFSETDFYTSCTTTPATEILKGPDNTILWVNKCSKDPKKSTVRCQYDEFSRDDIRLVRSTVMEFSADNKSAQKVVEYSTDTRTNYFMVSSDLSSIKMVKQFDIVAQTLAKDKVVIDFDRTQGEKVSITVNRFRSQTSLDSVVMETRVSQKPENYFDFDGTAIANSILYTAFDNTYAAIPLKGLIGNQLKYSVPDHTKLDQMVSSIAVHLHGDNPDFEHPDKGNPTFSSGEMLGRNLLAQDSGQSRVYLYFCSEGFVFTSSGTAIECQFITYIQMITGAVLTGKQEFESYIAIEYRVIGEYNKQSYVRINKDTGAHCVADIAAGKPEQVVMSMVGDTLLISHTFYMDNSKNLVIYSVNNKCTVEQSATRDFTLNKDIQMTSFIDQGLIQGKPYLFFWEIDRSEKPLWKIDLTNLQAISASEKVVGLDDEERYDPKGSSICFLNDKIFVATNRDGKPRFFLYDISQSFNRYEYPVKGLEQTSLINDVQCFPDQGKIGVVSTVRENNKNSPRYIILNSNLQEDIRSRVLSIDIEMTAPNCSVSFSSSHWIRICKSPLPTDKYSFVAQTFRLDSPVWYIPVTEKGVKEHTLEVSSADNFKKNISYMTASKAESSAFAFSKRKDLKLDDKKQKDVLNEILSTNGHILKVKAVTLPNKSGKGLPDIKVSERITPASPVLGSWRSIHPLESKVALGLTSSQMKILKPFPTEVYSQSITEGSDLIAIWRTEQNIYTLLGKGSALSIVRVKVSGGQYSQGQTSSLTLDADILKGSIVAANNKLCVGLVLASSVSTYGCIDVDSKGEFTQELKMSSNPLKEAGYKKFARIAVLIDQLYLVAVEQVNEHDEIVATNMVSNKVIFQYPLIGRVTALNCDTTSVDKIKCAAENSAQPIIQHWEITENGSIGHLMDRLPSCRTKGIWLYNNWVLTEVDIYASGLAGQSILLIYNITSPAVFYSIPMQNLKNSSISLQPAIIAVEDTQKLVVANRKSLSVFDIQQNIILDFSSLEDYKQLSDYALELNYNTMFNLTSTTDTPSSLTKSSTLLAVMVILVIVSVILLALMICRYLQRNSTESPQLQTDLGLPSDKTFSLNEQSQDKADNEL
jgi:hypothetical protein